MPVSTVFHLLLVLAAAQVIWIPYTAAAKARNHHLIKRDVEYQEYLNLADGSHHVIKRHLSDDPLSRQKRTKRNVLPSLVRVKRREEDPLDGLLSETPLERSKRYRRHAKVAELQGNEVIGDKNHEIKKATKEDESQIKLLHKDLKDRKISKEDKRAIKLQKKKRKLLLKKKNKRNKKLAKRNRELKKKLAAAKLQKKSNQKKQKKNTHKKHNKKSKKPKKLQRKDKKALKKNHHGKNKLE